MYTLAEVREVKLLFMHRVASITSAGVIQGYRITSAEVIEVKLLCKGLLL